MRVALVSDCWLPRVGGIERQTAGLAGALAAAGHEVLVLTATAAPGRAGEAALSREGGALVVRLPLPTRLPGLRGVPVSPWAGPALRALLAPGSVDVAHAHVGVISPFAWQGIDAALDAGLPTLVQWHSVVTGPGRAALGAAGLVRRWAERGAHLAAVSQVAAAPVRALAGGAPVTVLPDAVDASFWSAVPGVPGLPGLPGGPGSVGVAGGPGPQPLRVVTALRLAGRKRPLVALEAAAHAARQLAGLPDRTMSAPRMPGPAVRLDVYGDGRLRGRVQQEAARLVARSAGALEVRLHGAVEPEELRAAHRRADVLLAPTVHEAFGLAALEARACGVPVVAPACSGVGEIVADGVDALLTAPDARALGDALARLGCDPELLRRLRAGARRPTRLGWPQVLERSLALYRGLASARPPGPGGRIEA